MRPPSLLITVGSGIVAAAVLLLGADWLVAAVAADEVDQGAAASYLRVLALGLPLAGASAALRGYATGCGATKAVMRASIVLAVTDVGVAIALLATGGGPLSVAVSTVVGVGAGAATYLLWLRGRSRAGEPSLVIPPAPRLRPLAAEFARLGWPEAVMMLASAGAGVVVVFVISPAGEVALAAARWLDVVGLTSWIVLYAVGASVTTQMATSLGASDVPLSRRQARTAIRVTAAIAAVMTAAVALLAAPLARLGIDDPAVADAVRGVARAAAAQALWMALTVVANGVVRAHGDTRTPLRASLIAEYAVFLPLGVLLCRQLNLGLTGLFIAHHVYWAAFAAIAGWSALRHLRSTGAPVTR